jgi:hypothetical protein
MALSVDDYRRAWESDGSCSQRCNHQIIPGSCVLETLALVKGAGTRYIFVDDFGDAVSYCRQALCVDLTPPDQRENHGSPEDWRRLRAGFAPEDLAIAWTAADEAFSALLDAFITSTASTASTASVESTESTESADTGVAPALVERLRAVVNRYGLNLELGEIYVLPQDLAALLDHVGNPFVWWDDAMERAEQERQPFDFDNEQHRAMLARRLSEHSELD